jgi:hypothetical protein
MINQVMTSIRSWTYVYISVTFALLSVVAAIAWGPPWLTRFSLLGLFSALAGLLATLRKPEKYPSKAWGIVLCCLFTAFLLLSAVLKSLFLSPLRTEALVMPRLTNWVNDAQGEFMFRSPEGWSAEHKTTLLGEGVILRPITKNNYMGISEVHVFIRPLEQKKTPTTDLLAFLKDQLTPKRETNKQKQAFEWLTEPATLINEGEGLWTELIAKQLWVSFKQITLLGVKDNSAICAVSAIGLAEHATLSRVMCLGIFHTIKKTPTTE